MKSIVEHIFDHAIEKSSRLAVASYSVALDYAEFSKCINGYCAYLKAQGIQKGDRVVIQGLSHANYVVAYFAVHLAGAIAVAVDKTLPWVKVTDIASVTGARAAIVKKEMQIDGIGFFDIDDVLDLSKRHMDAPVPDFPGMDDPADILFTTGTTGKSKGIYLSHENTLASAENVKFGIEMEEDTIEVVPVPINHSYGLVKMRTIYLNGSSLVLVDGMSPIMPFFDALEKHRATAFSVVPASLEYLFKISKDKISQYKDQIRYVEIGTAACAEATKKKLMDYLPNARIIVSYGSTESARVCFNNVSKTKSFNSIGQPAVNVSLTIMDDERKPIASSKDNPGIIALKGPMNMLGYWGDEETTRTIQDKEYIYTNDLAYIDDNGYVVILGRKNNVINSGGKKVSPYEVEAAIQGYKGLVDCVCVPADDPAGILGKVPKAYLCLEDKDSFDKRDFVDYLGEKLEKYKIPAIIRIVDKIPRSQTGKAIYRQLPD